MKIGKTNQQKEKSPRGDTIITDPFICTPKSSIKALNWKP